MLGVVSLEQSHVDGQTRRVGQLVQERRREVGLQPTRTCRREIGVGDDERPSRRLDDDHRERLVGGRDPEPAPRSLVREQRRECVAERLSRKSDLGLGVVGRDLEQEREAAGAAELLEQMVEDRDARRDPALATCEIDARRAGARHSSVRSTDAPTARSRSSMRSYPRSIWPMLPMVDVPSAQSAAMSIAMPARMSGLSSRSP